MNPAFVTYIDLSTGRLHRLGRAHVADEAVTAGIAWLANPAGDSPVPLAGVPTGLTAKLVRGNGALHLSIAEGAERVAVIAIATKSLGATKLWERLRVEQSPVPDMHDWLARPGLPWCAFQVKADSQRGKAFAFAVQVFAESLAWAWIARKKFPSDAHLT